MRLWTKIPCITLASAFVALLSMASVCSAEVITTWNNQALDTVRDKSLGTASAGRLYALVNIAMYDAVNGIDVADDRSPRDFALVSPAGAPRNANRQAAAVAAAHAVLSALHPDRATLYDAQLDADLDALDGVSPPGAIARGQRWGESVGQEVVSKRANDGSSPQMIQMGCDPLSQTCVGEFRADFTSGQFALMDPFAIDDPLVYRSAGPPALTSGEYADDLNEVKQLGNKAIPDQNKEEVFRFWRAGGGTVRPPGEWIKIAIVVASTQLNDDCDDDEDEDALSREARLFALLGIALGDAVRVTWDSKVRYHFWRPATAIREADTDDNPDTQADPAWNPRNGSIGGSPEHTSGQTTFAGAGSTILAGFCDEDDVSFTFEGDNAIAGPRSFESFSDAAGEASLARIFAGIHFRFSLDAGQAAGQGLAEEILETALLPLEDDEEDDD